MSEQQECKAFNFDSIPGYKRLTKLEIELDKIEERYDKPKKWLLPENV